MTICPQNSSQAQNPKTPTPKTQTPTQIDDPKLQRRIVWDESSDSPFLSDAKTEWRTSLQTHSTADYLLLPTTKKMKLHCMHSCKPGWQYTHMCETFSFMK